MGRPSLRSQRRAELTAAFARVLATHGSGGATIAAVAAEAGMAPGLVHHYFSDKQDLYVALLDSLIAGFRRQRASARVEPDAVVAYADAALALDERADRVAARAWVGVLAEALSDPALFDKLRRLLDTEVVHIEQRARGALSTADASAVLAFIIGALVFGAFAPRKTAGFAAPALRRMLTGLRRR
jgi:TetR/AcrR family transcriptional repressor of bet genes